ncbi:hypothetical protein SAMN06269185_0471 [Natronoarchaeum philippinense]|uniref:Uncharacterized protein n=1 Tax=Natronoarchaeum philippinense TaxID=558529 RepID=A0A285N409_NATPI|nr:DUF5785 family protein [Natronoarchaeum philippinense]SNZ04170.1 hypothetical protein SAMN06269185_0471 [Natronoarchaeum philippinense]
MDWPHDPDDEKGSEGMRKYGMAIIAKKVDEDEDFPLSAEEFVADHGDEPIRINHQRVVSLEEIFGHVEAEEFETIVDMHKKVGAAIREGGYWDYHPVGSDPEIKRA